VSSATYSIPVISLAVAAFIIVFDNHLFWHNLAMRLGSGSFDHWKLMLTCGAILVLLFNLVFTLFSFRPIFKPFLVVVLLIAASVGYFSDTYGVVIDKSMINNIFETDIREAGELMTLSLLWHQLLYGILPATLVILVPIRYPALRRGLLLRTGVISVSLALALALFMTNFKGFVLFGRQNRDLQVFMNPPYPIYAMVKVVKGKYFAPANIPLQAIAADALRDRSDDREVVILVIGETARSSSLPENGYSRDTTPYTSHRDVINFSDVESCGTSTAESLPCMFSPFGRAGFSKSKAEHSENLLDILQRTGVKVVWRDNDSGSKHVADRVVYDDLSKKPASPFCADDNCYDEVLLDGLDSLIRSSQDDMLIVLHIKGSHGPSYYKRSPAGLKAFLPECTQDNVQDCPRETIVNAYDNTIVYTDYLLGKVVDILKTQDAETSMLYLSDHGESLGENGIYLHGLPYALAPAEQTHVPMMFWGSDRFYSNHRLDKKSLLARSTRPYSQDYLFHSILGLFHVRANVYNNDRDIFVNRG
jgi:lipid A ethanolaminephosphotransferase